jgi:hypothetical protein
MVVQDDACFLDAAVPGGSHVVALWVVKCDGPFQLWVPVHCIVPSASGISVWVDRISVDSDLVLDSGIQGVPGMGGFC